MLYAHKRALFSRWFAWIIHRRLRATFAQVTVRGLQHVLPVTKPTLMVVNHSAYWDAMLIVWLSERVLHTPGYAWMHRHNLVRLPFFRLLGAFGVDGRAPSDVKAGLAYACQRLAGSPCAMWIFPQGDEKPAARRPLGFAAGSAWLARRTPTARVVPVALSYPFGRAEKPTVEVCFGAPLPSERASAAQHEEAVTTLLDACARQDPTLATLAPGQQKFLPEPKPGEPLPTRWLSRAAAWYLKKYEGKASKGH